MKQHRVLAIRLLPLAPFKGMSAVSSPIDNHSSLLIGIGYSLPAILQDMYILLKLYFLDQLFDHTSEVFVIARVRISEHLGIYNIPLIFFRLWCTLSRLVSSTTPSRESSSRGCQLNLSKSI